MNWKEARKAGVPQRADSLVHTGDVRSRERAVLTLMKEYELTDWQAVTHWREAKRRRAKGKV